MLFDDNELTPKAEEGDKICGLADFLLYKKCSPKTYEEVMYRAAERRIEFTNRTQQVVGVTAVICGSRCMSDLSETVHRKYEEDMRQHYPHLFHNSSSTMSALGTFYLQNVVMEQISGTTNSVAKLTEYIVFGYKTLLDDVIVQHESSLLGGSEIYYSWWQKFEGMLSTKIIKEKISKYWKKDVNQKTLSTLQQKLRAQCYQLFQIPQPTNIFRADAAVFCDTCHTIIHPIPGICIYCLYATRSHHSSDIL